MTAICTQNVRTYIYWKYERDEVIIFHSTCNCIIISNLTSNSWIWQLFSIRLMWLSFWSCHLIRDFPLRIFLGVRYFCYLLFSYVRSCFISAIYTIPLAICNNARWVTFCRYVPMYSIVEQRIPIRSVTKR